MLQKMYIMSKLEILLGRSDHNNTDKTFIPVILSLFN